MKSEVVGCVGRQIYDQKFLFQFVVAFDQLSIGIVLCCRVTPLVLRRNDLTASCHNTLPLSGDLIPKSGNRAQTSAAVMYSFLQRNIIMPVVHTFLEAASQAHSWNTSSSLYAVLDFIWAAIGSFFAVIVGALMDGVHYVSAVFMKPGTLFNDHLYRVVLMQIHRGTTSLCRLVRRFLDYDAVPAASGLWAWRCDRWSVHVIYLMYKAPTDTINRISCCCIPVMDVWRVHACRRRLCCADVNRHDGGVSTAVGYSRCACRLWGDIGGGFGKR